MTHNRTQTAATLEKRLTRQAFYHLDTCTRCSACTRRCHMYHETDELIHSPAYKLALLRRVHRRYYTLAGRVAPKFFKAMELDDENFKEVSSAMFECTLCRRCTVHCPFGIDPPWPVSAGRFLCKTGGTAPGMLTMIAQVGLEKAKNISQYEDLYLEQIKTLETQLRTETHDPEARIPVKNRGAEVLYVSIAGVHMIMPVAKIFNATKDSWSLSLFDAANYSYFLGDIESAKILTGQIIKEAETLNVKSIVMTECGHGYRVMKQLAPEWFNRTFPFQVKSVVEIMANYIQDGRINLDPSANPEVVTYHGPCQLGRNSGIYEEPRTVLRAAAKEFRELAPQASNIIGAAELAVES